MFVDDYATPKPVPRAEPQERTLPLAFTGNTGEYFKIWIVNVFLTVLTLGIYSAWAKVRNKRYFYGNTLLDGAAFEYHATGRQLLPGRLIAMGLFVAYAVTSEIAPMFSLALILIWVGLFPFAIQRSLRFHSAMSSYRGVRFGFKGTVAQAYLKFLGLPILSAFTLNLLWPWVHKKQSEYRVGNSFYGTSQFTTTLETGRFYATYVKAVLLSLVLVVALLALAAGFAYALAGSQWAMIAMVYGSVLLVPIMLIVGLIAQGIINGGITNHIFNNTSINQNVAFQSTLTGKGLAWLYITNLVAIAMTLGLATPWARIRTMRYRAINTSVVMTTSLNDFAAAEQERHGALGEEVADVFDVDVGAL